MNVEIITIGNELLIGQILDRNSSWIAQKISETGLYVIKISSISDDKTQIMEVLDQAFSKAHLVLMTGGLGPTKDDITKKTLAGYFQTKLVFSPSVYADLENFFKKRGISVSELNKSQAEVPEICEPIRNPYGTAPGMWFSRGKSILVSMPGVPYEMKAMMEDYIIPRLKKEYQLPAIYKRTLLTTGIPESDLSDLIEAWEYGLPDHIKIAYLPSPGIVRLRISGHGKTVPGIKKEVENRIAALEEIIAPYIYGYEDDKLEEVVGRMLTSKNKTLSTAESCTGGKVSSMITSVSGSSTYFKGSLIAYSNEIKQNFLEVKNETLTSEGAVSEPVVREMALSCNRLLNTDYAIAISGIAGPTGCTNEKPVGTTWIAVANGNQVNIKKFQFGDNRERNILKASIHALNMLRLQLLNEP